MSRDLNKWMGIGRLGQDPEVVVMPNGTPVANLSIACGDDYKDKQTGQKVEQTEWVRLVAFGRLAEVLSEYTRKGSKIYAEGKLRTREWEKDGVKRYSTEIVISDMQMLDTKDGNSNQARAQQQQNAYGNQGQQQGHHPNAGATTMHQPPQQQGGYQQQAPQGQYEQQQGGYDQPPPF